MYCAYCGKETKGTKEHIISCAILDLFPECFLTFDGERNKIYEGDPMIKDVCADCNNCRISYIDSYAAQIIKKYFLKKYDKDDVITFEYDYALIQKMCLKYAYNALRASKSDISFFDDGVKHYLMNEDETTPLSNVTILAGFAVNTTPVMDFVFGNQKLQWQPSPFLCENSIIENIDYFSGKVTLRENLRSMAFDHLALSYVFRFNSLQIVLLCWDKSISDESLKQNNVILEIQYPYKKLTESGNSELRRCTSVYTYHHIRLIDVTWGQGIMDELEFPSSSGAAEARKQLEILWEEEEKKLASEHKRSRK